MSKAVVSVLVYQVDGNKMSTPQTFGLPVAEITKSGLFPTRQAGTWKRLESTVDESIYRVVSTGVQVKNGRHGYKTYYTTASVAALVADINA
jgi:hypothetical protein